MNNLISYFLELFSERNAFHFLVRRDSFSFVAGAETFGSILGIVHYLQHRIHIFIIGFHFIVLNYLFFLELSLIEFLHYLLFERAQIGSHNQVFLRA